MPLLSVSFRLKFELRHGFCMSRVEYCATLDPNGYRQWARPSLRVFILKELNAAECEGLASETRIRVTLALLKLHQMAYLVLQARTQAGGIREVRSNPPIATATPT